MNPPKISLKRFLRLSQLPFLASLPLLLLASPVSAQGLGGLEQSFQAALHSGSSGAVLAMIYVFGLATALTPCVYPMIVITVSVFGARQAKSKIEGAKLSTAFVFGMATFFTPLGIIAAVTGGVFGEALSSPWILVGLALILVALAASMFGAFELSLPSSFQNRLAKVGGFGVKGAFALGSVSALIAAPCTGPALAGLLVWIGDTGNVAFGALALFVYALGIGTLYWVVGTFAISLPKSGRWLEWIKSGFGIVLLAAALYFTRDLLAGLYALISKDPQFLFGSIALIAAGVLIGAIHLSFHTQSALIRVRKSAGIVLALAGFVGLIGYSQALPEGASIAWQQNYEKAKSYALQKGKPLLVDFGASWCAACQELEHETFGDKRVVAESERFVSVRIDLSPGKDSPEKRALLKSYKQRGLPLVVLHDPRGTEVNRVTGFVNAEDFLNMMQKVY